MVRIIMHGCNGKMGQVITRLAAEDGNCQIVAGIDTFRGIENTYPVFDNLKDCDVEADVVIDFSNAKAVDGLFGSLLRKETSGSALYDRSFRRAASESGRRGKRDGCS